MEDVLTGQSLLLRGSDTVITNTADDRGRWSGRRRQWGGDPDRCPDRRRRGAGVPWHPLVLDRRRHAAIEAGLRHGHHSNQLLAFETEFAPLPTLKQRADDEDVQKLRGREVVITRRNVATEHVDAVVGGNGHLQAVLLVIFVDNHTRHVCLL